MADQSTQSTPPGPVTEEDLLRGIQIIQEGRRELQEQTRMSLEKRRELEARIKAMEEQLPILQKRVDETNACFAEVDKYLDQYIKTHKPEDAKVRGRALIEEYKRYFDNPGLPCPVDKKHPLVEPCATKRGTARQCFYAPRGETCTGTNRRTA
jgi:hypothetical protein